METGMMDGGGAAGEGQRLSTAKPESSLLRQHNEPKHTHEGGKPGPPELMLRPNALQAS